jgi:hypothetical protein
LSKQYYPKNKAPKHFFKPLNLYSYKAIQIGLKKLISIYMGKLFLIMNEVFLDTSFAIALASITDQHHARAVQLAHQLQASQARLVTTQAILLEIGNALSQSKYRMGAIQVFQVDQVGTGQCPLVST